MMKPPSCRQWLDGAMIETFKGESGNRDGMNGMVCIRHFTENDIDAIRANQYPVAAKEEILNMLHGGNAGSFHGKSLEMFAVLFEDTVVGSVSLFQSSQNIASLGLEIYQAYRQRGFASQTMRLAMDHAKKLGYKIIQNQARADNIASICLRERLSFESDYYIYKNKKDQPAICS